jgi:hypothetical protein
MGEAGSNWFGQEIQLGAACRVGSKEQTWHGVPGWVERTNVARRAGLVERTNAVTVTALGRKNKRCTGLVEKHKRKDKS